MVEPKSSIPSVGESRCNVSELIPGNHYEFELKGFVTDDGLVVQASTIRRKVVQIIQLGQYQFVKVARDDGVKHLLLACRIMNYKPLGIMCDLKDKKGAEH
ncbi:MAG: hypothetical protein AB2761_20630 [Candidatus Thiodiazotropha endolucinida]